MSGGTKGSIQKKIGSNTSDFQHFSCRVNILFSLPYHFEKFLAGEFVTHVGGGEDYDTHAVGARNLEGFAIKTMFFQETCLLICPSASVQ